MRKRLPKSLIFAMLTFSLSFGSAIASSAGALPHTKVDVSFSNAKVEKVLDYLTRKTDVQFIYRDGLLDNSVVSQIDMKNATIIEVLDKVLRQNGFDYEIDESVVVVKRGVQNPPPATMTIKGRVVDKSGRPLIGASVVVPSTNLGISTDGNGNFALNLPSETQEFVVRYVGMVEQRIGIGTRREFVVTLDEKPTQLESVVVTGIFNKAKESYTGAVTTVTQEQLRMSGNRDLLTTLQSIDPSFSIADNNALGSDPNAIPDITIRGHSSMTSDISGLKNDTRNLANTPLFILNGFEIKEQRMMDLDQNQIESITILKDASATAMYGTRGANGVVVITTRKPKTGRLMITYKGGIDIEAPDLQAYNLLNAREKLEFELAAGLYSMDVDEGSQSQELLELYNKRRANVERGVDTYWLKYPVRVGVGQRQSLILEGGENSIRYSLTASYRDIAGAMKGSNRKIFNGSVYLSYQYKNMTFSNDLEISHTKAINSPYGNFSDWANVNSYHKPYDDEGNLVDFLDLTEYHSIRGSKGLAWIPNPLYNALLPSINESKYTEISERFMLEWKITPELIMRGSIGITSFAGRSDDYKSARHTDFTKYEAEDFQRRGRYKMDWEERFNYTAKLNLAYNKTIGDKHTIFAGIDLNASEDTDENYRVVGEGITNDRANFLSLASLYEKGGSPKGSEGISRRVGAIFSVNYTYDMRYFVDVSGTVEAASKFGSKNRTAPFWSVGAGWNIHHERFMSGSRFVNRARLKVSYGTTGSQNFDPYMAMRTFRYYGTENYNGMTGAYLVNIGNPDLGWQKTYQLNIGFEVEFLDGRIKTDVNLYDKLTDDMLTDITLPSAGGFKSYKANMGKVSNRGIEAGANISIIRNREKNIHWSIGATLSHNENKIKEISNSLDFLNKSLLKDGKTADLNPSFLFQEGQSMRTIFAVRSLGIDPSNGKEIFVTADGQLTYVWDAKDKVPCGIEEPLFRGNGTMFLRIGGFSLNAIFGMRWGGQTYNKTLASKVENINPYNNADKRVLYDRWKNPGDVTEFKSVKDFSETKATTRFIFDENTFNIKNITLSYEFKGEWLKRNLSVSYLNLAVYGEDLLYMSSIKRERGTSYPYARKFSCSIIARF